MVGVFDVSNEAGGGAKERGVLRFL